MHIEHDGRLGNVRIELREHDGTSGRVVDEARAEAVSFESALEERRSARRVGRHGRHVAVPQKLEILGEVPLRSLLDLGAQRAGLQRARPARKRHERDRSARECLFHC